MGKGALVPNAASSVSSTSSTRPEVSHGMSTWPPARRDCRQASAISRPSAPLSPPPPFPFSPPPGPPGAPARPGTPPPPPPPPPSLAAAEPPGSRSAPTAAPVMTADGMRKRAERAALARWRSLRWLNTGAYTTLSVPAAMRHTAPPSVCPLLLADTVTPEGGPVPPALARGTSSW
jgi:hypothetical protein